MNKKQDIAIISGILLLILSFFIENRFFGIIDAIKNPFFDLIFQWASQITTVAVILILMTSLFMWEEHKKRWIPVLYISTIGSWLLGNLLKWIIMRPRPFGAVVTFLGMPTYSMPSCHAIVAFAAIPVLDKTFPKLKWLWIAFAFLVAFSRVYLEVHYLSDVIAGALLGYAIGVIMVRLELKHGWFKSADKK